MASNSEPTTPNEFYSTLPEFEGKRCRELSGMLQPYIEVTDEYGELICRVVLILGRVAPTDLQDKVVRDLMADVFDFLYEARSLVLRNKCGLAYLLSRRAYESLSLMTLCCFDNKYAAKWDSGEEISNSEVRKELAKHPLGEAEKATRDLYGFFSKVGHPNRDFIPERFLGVGNEFVLGPYLFPPLILITASSCSLYGSGSWPQWSITTEKRSTGMTATLVRRT